MSHIYILYNVLNDTTIYHHLCGYNDFIKYLLLRYQILVKESEREEGSDLFIIFITMIPTKMADQEVSSILVHWLTIEFTNNYNNTYVVCGWIATLTRVTKLIAEICHKSKLIDFQSVKKHLPGGKKSSVKFTLPVKFYRVSKYPVLIVFFFFFWYHHFYDF